MKKRVLIIASETNFSFQNPNSAVAGYLLTLKEGIEQAGYLVDTYPQMNSEGYSPVTPQRGLGKLSGSFRRIIRLVFPRLYVTLQIRKKILSLESASEQIATEYEKPDLIIEFLSLGSGISMRIKQKFQCTSLIIYDAPLLEQFIEMHGYRPFNASRIAQLEKQAVENSDIVLCYAPSVQKYLTDNFKINGRIFVQPCITWKEEIPLGESRLPMIGFIGSFLKWHKVDLLVRAFEQVAHEYPLWKLVLIGYGQEWPSIKQMVSSNKFSDRIEMPGFVSEEQLKEYKKQFSIGVMPGSNWYGSPLKLFEYAQSSVAIVAPETPVVCDLFDKSEALFIKKNDPLQSLVENLRKLMSSEECRLNIIDRSFAKMKGDYSRSEQLNKFREIIKSALSDGITE